MSILKMSISHGDKRPPNYLPRLSIKEPTTELLLTLIKAGNLDWITTASSQDSQVELRPV